MAEDGFDGLHLLWTPRRDALRDREAKDWFADLLTTLMRPTERSEPMKNEDRAQELTRLIARAETQLAMLRKIPDEDTYADGAVVRVVCSPLTGSVEDTLTYVLLKIAHPTESKYDRWYFTGSLTGDRGKRYFTGWTAVRAWLQSHRSIVSIDELVPVAERDEARRVAEGLVRSEFEGRSPIKWDDHVPWPVES